MVHVEWSVSAEWLIVLLLESFETFRDDLWDSDASGISDNRGAAETDRLSASQQTVLTDLAWKDDVFECKPLCDILI